MLEKEKEKINKDLVEQEKSQKELELELEIISKAAKEARKQAGETLEIMGTHALQYIFEENKSLEIKFNERDECHIYVTKEIELDDGTIEKAYMDPATAEGGGLADTVDFALRLALYANTEVTNDFSLLFDEPSKYVSKGKELGNPRRVAAFFKDIAHDWDKQIIIVSHNDELISAADKSFKISLDIDKNISQLEIINQQSQLAQLIELVNNETDLDE